MSRPPVTLLGAAALQAAVALAVLGFGAYGLVSMLRGHAVSVEATLPLALFALVVGAALGYVAWGLAKVKDWARSPVVVTQLFLLPIAWYLWQTDAPAAAGACAVVATAGLALVLAPPSTSALHPDADAA